MTDNWIPTSEMPPKSEAIIISIEDTGRWIDVVLEIKGITFKRTQDKWKQYPPLWTDVYSYFGQRDLCSKDKEAELESIYQTLKPQSKYPQLPPQTKQP